MLLCIISLNNSIPYQWAAASLNTLVHIPMVLNPLFKQTTYFFLIVLLLLDSCFKNSLLVEKVLNSYPNHPILS